MVVQSSLLLFISESIATFCKTYLHLSNLELVINTILYCVLPLLYHCKTPLKNNTKVLLIFVRGLHDHVFEVVLRYTVSKSRTEEYHDLTSK